MGVNRAERSVKTMSTGLRRRVPSLVANPTNKTKVVSRVHIPQQPVKLTVTCGVPLSDLGRQDAGSEEKFVEYNALDNI